MEREKKGREWNELFFRVSEFERNERQKINVFPSWKDNKTKQHDNFTLIFFSNLDKNVHLHVIFTFVYTHINIFSQNPTTHNIQPNFKNCPKQYNLFKTILYNQNMNLETKKEKKNQPYKVKETRNQHLLS